MNATEKGAAPVRDFATVNEDLPPSFWIQATSKAGADEADESCHATKIRRFYLTPLTLRSKLKANGLGRMRGLRVTLVLTVAVSESVCEAPNVDLKVLSEL